MNLTSNNILTLIIIVIISSCNSQKGIHVEIQNLSNETIKDIKVYTTETNSSEYFLENLDPLEKGKGFLNMEKNSIDGSYLISFKRMDGEEVTIGNGYYTNGAPMNSKAIFLIESDTVLIRFKGFGL